MKPLTKSTDGMQLLENGQPFIWRGILAWPLAGRFLNEGDAVAASVMRDYRACGANIISCAAMLSWWPNLTPTSPGWWAGWIPFARLAQDEGLRLCIVVFCDTRSRLPNPASWVPHWERFYTQLGAEPNVSLVAVNQPGHPTQASGLDPKLFSSPAAYPNILCARDNPLESGNPTLPALDFSCYCSTRDETKGWVEVGSSMHYVVAGWPSGEWTGTHQASVLFEPAHVRVPGPWADPGKWRQLARSLSFRGTIGGNFYSDQCATASALTGVERSCAVEYLGNIPGV